MPEFDPSPPLSIVLGLVALQAGYLLSTGELRARFAGSSPVPASKQWLFGGGVAVLFLALASPLHALSEDYLFTAHMVQHLLLTLVAAPLLLAGTPGWLLRAILAATRLAGVARFLLHPVVAFLAFNVVFLAAHLPGLYEQALALEPFHAIEHQLFLVTAFVFWLPILSPLPDALPRYPVVGQILYFFAQMFPSTLLGALLTHADRPLYPTYEMAPRIVPELGALADQQIGGLLMWVGGGTYFVLAAGVVFFLWAQREEMANRRPDPGPGSTSTRPSEFSKPLATRAS